MKSIRFLGVIIFFFLFISGKTQGLDVRIIKNFQSHQSKGMNNSMMFISNSAYVVTPAVPIALFSHGLIAKNQKNFEAGLQISSAILLSTALVFSSKEIIKRPRPYEKYPDIVYKLSGEGGYSMPSAHTSYAFSMATSLSLQYPKWYTIAPSFLWAGTVAYSRIYLGDHYPSDVLVGACVGAATAYVTYKIWKVLQSKK